MKNHIIILKEKLNIVENYLVRTQSTFIEMINILDFIIKYLRKNDRMTDVEVIEMIKDE